MKKKELRTIEKALVKFQMEIGSNMVNENQVKRKHEYNREFASEHFFKAYKENEEKKESKINNQLKSAEAKYQNGLAKFRKTVETHGIKVTVNITVSSLIKRLTEKGQKPIPDKKTIKRYLEDIKKGN